MSKKKSSVRDVKFKGVEIELDKVRTLKFDLNAFAELEDAYGTVEDAMKAMEKGSIKALRAVLWSGLVHEDEELTLKQVGSMISISDLQNFTNKITQAVSGSVPDSNDIDPNL